MISLAFCLPMLVRAWVLPAFAQQGALVYVLPEVKTLEQVFGFATAVAS